MMRESEAAGAIHRAASVAELARALKLDAAVLQGALVAREGRRQLVGSLHYALLTHGVLTTQGGTASTTSGEVLRRDGTTMPGL
jgi:fumarate reductase flavoprotein subunit